MYMFDGAIILYFFHMHDCIFMALLIVYITCTSTEAFGLSSHPNMHDIYIMRHLSTSWLYKQTRFQVDQTVQQAVSRHSRKEGETRQTVEALTDFSVSGCVASQ